MDLAEVFDEPIHLGATILVGGLAHDRRGVNGRENEGHPPRRLVQGLRP